MKIKPISDFFNNEYVNYASYDVIRKIPSLIDGQKNAARKALWYVVNKNLNHPSKEVKVSQLDSKVAESEEYLHGSMAGVIVNLAQDYPGTNNMNMLFPSGNFGTRLVPEASASRYIYTYGTQDLFSLINKEDHHILEGQTFEGHDIEPKFLLPSLPLLLINGTEGIASGYASKILPRNPELIKKYLTSTLKGDKKAPRNLWVPYFKGFRGTVAQGEENQWIISGAITRKANKVTITELPIGYNLKSYIKVLDRLEEQKLIVSYCDFTEDNFSFLVTFNRKILDNLSDEALLDYLKLRKKVTENFTTLNALNQVQVFQNPEEIFNEYYQVKLRYIQKRKDQLIASWTQNIREQVSRYMFIKGIQDETIIINKRSQNDIIKSLQGAPKIIQKDSSYDYLLNMPISSLSKEKMERLLVQIKTTKESLDKIKTSPLEQMWLEDL